MVATRTASTAALRAEALREAEWWYQDMRGASRHARIRLERVSKRDKARKSDRFRGLKRAAKEAARYEAEALVELNEAIEECKSVPASKSSQISGLYPQRM